MVYKEIPRGASVTDCQGCSKCALALDLGAIRGHWGIENSLHWVLDVVFREDESRHYAGHSGENLALLRRLAIGLLKQEKTSDSSLKTKRLRCGWDNDYIAKVLAATNLEDA
jgi:hypothetical protein